MDFNKLLNAAKEKGITDIEVYERVSEAISVETFNSKIDKNTVENSTEIYVRGVYNNHIAAIYVENDSDDEIENIIKRLIENAKVIESNDPYFIYEGDKDYPKLEEKENDFDEYSLDDLANLCIKYENEFKAKCPNIVNSKSVIEIYGNYVSIKNSNGLNVNKKSRNAVFVIQTMIKVENDVKTGFAFQYLNNIKDIDKEKAYKFAVERPLSSIGAKSYKSSQYPVVFENKVASSLIATFSSMFSAEVVLKKASPLQDKIGTDVFGKNITITDEPLNKISFNQTPFDDEGVKAFNKEVVKDGKLVTYLHNLKTAKMMNTKSTGNGFKDRSGNIAVSISNLCFKTSNISFDDMIKDIKEGIYITSIQGLHAGANSVSGAFNLQSSGYVIRDGKIAEAVTLIIVSGNFIDMLNDIKCISNDFEINSNVGTGSILVNSLSVSGK
ncbi:MAG: TldD/PmbA family protein [Acholeplasmatales bacterium]|nr:TldD/PmbA family protein [Acholeplasmatales bacterium]